MTVALGPTNALRSTHPLNHGRRPTPVRCARPSADFARNNATKGEGYPGRPYPTIFGPDISKERTSLPARGALIERAVTPESRPC